MQPVIQDIFLETENVIELKRGDIGVDKLVFHLFRDGDPYELSGTQSVQMKVYLERFSGIGFTMKKGASENEIVGNVISKLTANEGRFSADIIISDFLSGRQVFHNIIFSVTDEEE